MTETTTHQIRRLNARGMEVFQMYFDRKTPDRTTEISDVRNYAPPVEILFDEQYSEEIDGCGVVPEKAPEDKISIARAVIAALGARHDALRFDANVWSWLTLLWHEAIIPPTTQGEETFWSLKETPAYCLSTTSRFRFRHRIWGPCALYADFGELSRTLQGGALDEMTKVVDHVSFRNVITPEILKAMDLAYFDADEGKLLDGATADRSKRGSNDVRKGGIPDFVDVVLQIGRRYSIDRLTAPEIVEKLPAAFAAFQENATRRIKDGKLAPDMPAITFKQVAFG
jgi:hypothetical protein